MTRLRPSLFAAIVGLLAAAGTWACNNAQNGSVAPSAVGPGSAAAASGGGSSSATIAAKPGGVLAYQLNLSHITCIGTSGKVEIHFVLLNLPDGTTPGNLTFAINGVNQTPVSPGPHTGNVWHYTANVADGVIDVTSASVLVGTTTVQLHNAHDYAGVYRCTEDLPLCPAVNGINTALQCAVVITGGAQAECDFFLPGSRALNKDESGAVPGTAITSAALAIVTAGSGQTGCANPLKAYQLIKNPTVGSLIPPPGTGTSISHITYCSCPIAQ